VHTFSRAALRTVYALHAQYTCLRAALSFSIHLLRLIGLAEFGTAQYTVLTCLRAYVLQILRFRPPLVLPQSMPAPCCVQQFRMAARRLGRLFTAPRPNLIRAAVLPCSRARPTKYTRLHPITPDSIQNSCKINFIHFRFMYLCIY
jgi:hypothetical protein